MNQQRSRRFRSSKEREALLADYVAKEGKLPDEESFDSNCITPGTEFMFRLGDLTSITCYLQEKGTL